MIILKSTPVRLSNNVAITLSVSLVDKQLSLVVRRFINTKHSSFMKFLFQTNSLIDFIPDTILSLLDKMNLIYVIQLVVDESLGFIVDWFKHLEHVFHEFVVLFVVPVKKAMAFMFTRILNFKITIEANQKCFKQEISIDLELNSIW